MAILEVGAHIGDLTDEVVNRVRPATTRMLDAAWFLPHALRSPRPDVGRRATDVIVPREMTRC